MESTLNFLDWIIIIILVFMIIAILIGKGEAAIRLFNGKNFNNDPNRPKYNEKKLEKGILGMCVSFLVVEMIYKFVTPLWAPAAFIALGLTVVTLIVTLWYVKKYAEEKKK